MAPRQKKDVYSPKEVFLSSRTNSSRRIRTSIEKVLICMICRRRLSWEIKSRLSRPIQEVLCLKKSGGPLWAEPGSDFFPSLFFPGPGLTGSRRPDNDPPPTVSLL